MVTADRRPLLANPGMVDLLRGAFRTVRSARQFTVDAMVILPDHLHCIWTLPRGDGDFATRWRLIKARVTKQCGPELSHAHPKRPLWQNRYWEHVLRDETDLCRHLDYIHHNPVKHGLAATAWEWPYSSFRRYVEAGIYPQDWGGGVVEYDGVGRE